MVSRVVAEEIGAGEGANFVIKRTFVADIADHGRSTAALAFFRRLLDRRVRRVLDVPGAHRRRAPSSAPPPSGTSAWTAAPPS